MAENLGFIQEKDIADFARLMRDYRAGRLFADPNRPTPVNQPSQRWIRAKNMYDETIPAFGVVAVVNAEHFETTQVLLHVTAPGYTSGDDLAGTFAFNSSAPILPGETGLVTMDTPTWGRLYAGDYTPGVSLCDSVTFHLSEDLATGIDPDKTLNCQLLSDPVPISGGYIGLVNLPADRCHAVTQLDTPSFTSGGSGQITLASTGHARGVDFDYANDVFIFKKGGVFLVELSAAILAQENSYVEFEFSRLDADDSVSASATSAEYGCTFSADGLSGAQTLTALFRALMVFDAGQKLKLDYSCSTDAGFYLTWITPHLAAWRLG